ncbi:conserved hypothetical protein [Bradyrhizobium oligotrophicum S58]|uniref:Uncharacterized protein n=2 Tax=Bradyrhizobium oligotrophicum TaxID=44255 RepID=M4Z663_9BRAD|nr:conserved hypothetical protein [Bradyrhizobium oligotrophicum S58]
MPTRSNVRDRFAMVDEVFALSPISARAAQPNETDYEAIRDAFMETSRGRWFLGEYAKRNRNADTSMVLDAVARIEHALASQRQQQQEFEQADSKALPEALAAIRATVEDAALAAASAVDSMALEQNLAPVRKGIRIIKEISWRWREIGADSRICDLIDSQVTSIEAACDQLASADPKVALLAAFEIIKTRLKELDDGQATVLPTADERVAAAEAAAPPSQDQDIASSPATEAPASAQREIVREPQHAPEPAAAAQPAPAANTPLMAAVAAIETIATPSAATTVLVATATVEVQVATQAATVAQPADAIALPAIAAEPSIAEALVAIEQHAANVEDAAAAEAQDEAILELVAAEMGAPDPIEDEEFSRARTLGFDIEEPTSVDDDIIASFSEPAPAEPESAPSEPEPVLTKTEALVAKPAAPPALAPPAAPAAVASVPMPAPLPESIAIETLAAVAAAMAPQAPAAPPQAEIAPSRPVQTTAATPPSTTAYAMPKPAYEPSLGSTLLSNGLLQRPQVPANDPLSPIRRMSQPEKIAFFS